MVEHGRHISIGRFAGLTGISANTLRRYDELGVLSPAFTDPETRYRLYAVEQLDTGILIRLLRDLDVPLKEIAAQIGDGDPGRLRDALAVHRERIAGRLVELERILQRLDGALETEHGLLPNQIEVVTLEPIWVVSRRTVTPRSRLDEELDRCLLELEDELASAADCATGRELILYHNALYWYQGLDMEVCLPVSGDAAAAHGGRQLPGGDCHADHLQGPLGRHLARVLDDARAYRARRLRCLRPAARGVSGRRAGHGRSDGLRHRDHLPVPAEGRVLRLSRRRS